MNSRVWDEINAIRFDAFSKIHYKNKQEKYAALLMTRVSELCQDSHLLLKENRIASAPIILRSALESYVDLMCVIKDIDYIDEINKSFDFYKKKVKGEQVNLRELLSIKKKFELADELGIYNGFYAHLCRNSHGNVEMLVNYHAVGENISIGHTPDLNEVKTLENQAIALTASALISGLKLLGKFDSQINLLEHIQKRAGSGKYV
ncbi:DUF5677 domain-containing protein [Pseudoalteromonas agarivorans]|uniref:Uncharacterized protein n=1 Tax=Pseudoalteromonas agarivorans DSM 14585 TaxID=1312369 RepID=A0ACA8E2C6_9GAMM|nr:DUF5677 domain-containing protein [Pseudoalteromonas agarivorans]ATC84391.1 hypothetical protein PAGA_b0489 [Pseudoalteromonas agarivorans DSM 14585]